MEVTLLVLEGKQKGRAIPLPETIFMIGRDPQCHIRPHCQLVSKLHCAIAAWAGKVRLRDLKSRNGTFLNGQPVQGEVTVEDGDRLQVGTLIFEFRIRRAVGDPVAAPVRDELELQWLLDSPADSGVLAPERKTAVILTHPEQAGSAPPHSGGSNRTSAQRPGAATHAGSKNLSAGQLLRAHVEKRKRRLPPAPPSAAGNGDGQG